MSKSFFYFTAAVAIIVMFYFLLSTSGFESTDLLGPGFIKIQCQHWSTYHKAALPVLEKNGCMK